MLHECCFSNLPNLDFPRPMLKSKSKILSKVQIITLHQNVAYITTHIIVFVVIEITYYYMTM
jgi:hypothetical protein